MNLIIRAVLFLSTLALCSCTIPTHGFHPPSFSIIKPKQLIEAPLVKLLSARGTQHEIEELLIAIDQLNQVYGSECFQREIFTRTFLETDGMNNQEIFNQLRSDIKAIHVSFYTGSFFENHFFQVVGFIRESIPDTVFQNRHFVKNHSDMARNLIHEVAHLWGFNHFQFLPATVPYQMNRIWDICSEELGLD